jgi:hypothetical protein
LALLSVIASLWIAQDPSQENKIGAARIYRAGAVEAQLKTIQMGSDEAAKRMAEVNLGLIKGLYAPKKNPYEGEVTSLVQCQKKFSAEDFKARCPEGPVPAIVGGAGERRNFGMCTKEDIRFSAVFFSCYDQKAKLLTEVRLFVPFENGSWDKARAEAKAWAGKLFP